MKVFLLSVLTLGLSFFGMAQTFITGNPPGVEWSKTDLWPVNPIIYNTAYPNGMPAEKSGEDWYYDVEKRKNSVSGLVEGYIFSGYCTMPDFNVDNYPMSLFAAWDECGHSRGNYGGCPDLRRYDPANPQYNLLMGEPMPIITLTDLNGNYNPTTDYRILPLTGDILKSIQANDGGYVVTGRSLFHSSLNIVNGQITGLTKIQYNPGYALPNSTFNCGDGWDNSISYVAKLNSDLSTAWIYFYGFSQVADNSAFAKIEISDMIPCAGGYILCGRDDNSPGRSMLIKIDNTGQIQNGWPKQYVGMDKVYSMKRTLEGGNEYFYALGAIDNPSTPIVSKLATDGTEIWRTELNFATESMFWIDNLVLSTQGDVIVSFRGSTIPTTCYLAKLDDNTGTIMNTFIDNNSNLKAQELKYKVVATSDGGCAVAATSMRYQINNWNTPEIPLNFPYNVTTDKCIPDYSRWNTDAYVAKFNSNLTRIWSTVFDANTATPSGTALDILSQCSSTDNLGCPISSWQIPNLQGLDVSRQECIFDIEETPDGGLILAGKNSRNLDDCYIVKLCPDETPLVIENEVINNIRTYKNFSITVNNSSFVSPTKTSMEACRFVLFKPKTTVEYQAVLTASINTEGCCNVSGPLPPGQGMRVANSDEQIMKNFTPEIKTWNIESAISPNPNRGSFNFSMNFPEAEIVTIDVVNSIGAVVYCKSNIPCNGALMLDITLERPISGVYYIKAYTKTKMHTKKMVIQ